MSAAPSSPPRHNRRLRDYAKLAAGKVIFAALVSGGSAASLENDALEAALYYASDEVTGAVGTNKIRKAVRAEAKKRGIPVR